MIDTITNSLNGKNRGVRQARFVVTKYNSVPSILIELGFITGSSDHINLKKQVIEKNLLKLYITALKQFLKNTLQEDNPLSL